MSEQYLWPSPDFEIVFSHRRIFEHLGWPAFRSAVLKGRKGGDYDLSRLLRRTRWCGGGGSGSTHGFSVSDVVGAMEDPLGLSRRAREVCPAYCSCTGVMREGFII